MINTVFDGEVKEYWVVFTQGTHLLSRILKKNFSHCYVITRDKYNWIVLNPHRLQLQIEIPAVPIDVDLPRAYALPNDRIVKITIHKRETSKVFARFGLINCVVLIRYLLGIRIYTLTPFHLYRRLIHLTPRQLTAHGIQSVKQIA